MNRPWHTADDATPPAAGVYEVQATCDNQPIGIIAHKCVLAFWDGASAWSYPWCHTTGEMHTIKMMPSGRRLAWRERSAQDDPVQTMLVLNQHPARDDSTITFSYDSLKLDTI